MTSHAKWPATAERRKSMRSERLRCTIGSSMPFCEAASRNPERSAPENGRRRLHSRGCRAGGGGCGEIRQFCPRRARLGILSAQPSRRLSCFRVRAARGEGAAVAGKSKEEAIALAETVDRDRAAYIKQYFDIEWPARHFFHLMINSILGDEMVVQTFLGSIALLDNQSA